MQTTMDGKMTSTTVLVYSQGGPVKNQKMDCVPSIFHLTVSFIFSELAF